jgi:hypothetical protein
MITASGINKTTAATVLILGLTRGNIDRLIAGRPMLLRSASHLAVPEGLEIYIHFGETHEDVQKEMEKVHTINSEATIHEGGTQRFGA